MKQFAFGLALVLVTNLAAFAVIGGKADATLERHTVMVLSTKGSLCSGAVIARRTVLTAAHCVDGKADYAVHFRDETGAPVLLKPKRIVIHPDYVADAITKRVRSIDLALITLTDPLPAQFAPVTLAETMPRAGEEIVIGGYGMTDETQRTRNGQFLTTRLKVVEPYGPSKILIWLKGSPITGTQLATGGCHGDSGGPLFSAGQLVAITTWTTGPKGRDCGELTQGALIAPQRDFLIKSMND